MGPTLRRVSELMRSLNQNNVEEDSKFWIRVVSALAVARWRPVEASEPNRTAMFGVPAADPKCIFGLLSPCRSVCCAASCGHCEQRASCVDLLLGPESCCPNAILASNRSCVKQHAPCFLQKSVGPAAVLI